MASKDEAKKQYQHFVPMAKPVPDWYKLYEFVLVTSMEQLNQVFIDAKWEPGKSFISFDTETTGLNFEELDLVGYSFCIDGKKAVYVPVNHFEYEHNLGEPAVEYIYNRMCEARQVFMYNARYDCRVLEYRGIKEQSEEFKKKRHLFVKYDMSKVNVFDVMNSVFDSDSNDKLPSLKNSSLRFLGYEQMHFDEVIEEAGNFYYLNPSENFDTVYYAAADALCTFLLVPATMKYYQESKVAGQLDNAVIYPLMHYEAEKIFLDKEKLERMMSECEVEVDKLEKEVYAAIGYQINLNSPAQVAQALERLGIDTGERTSSGNMATGMKILEQLPQEVKDKFPALKSFLKYKEENKLLTTYFKVYLEEAQKKGYLRASYKIHNVPTGRLSAGKDGKNTFFSPVNIQAMPKPHVAMYDVYDFGDQYRNYFSKKDNVIMGYAFVKSTYDANGDHVVPQDSRYIGWAEGMDPHLNLRDCILAKMDEDSNLDEWVVVACDYAAQELRLVANMSHEPVWENAFAEGRDVHKSTAEAVWGAENYNKDYRKKAKSVNFAVVYGASASSFNDPFYDIHSMAEAEEFYENYKSKLPTLFQWIERKQRQGRRDGTVYTYFGRPRRVKGYFDEGNFGFANRTIVNTQIQGTAADILKLVMVKLWKNLLNHPDYKDDVRFLVTIHDEIQFVVRASKVNEITSLIEENMTLVLKEWRVPIITEASIAFTSGSLFAWEKVQDNTERGFTYRPKLD